VDGRSDIFSYRWGGLDELRSNPAYVLKELHGP
jgi:hypothetical protein